MRIRLRISLFRLGVAALAAGAAPVLRDIFVMPLAGALRTIATRLFDQNGAWCLWLGLGLAMGSALHSRGRRHEEAFRGGVHRPSLRYLKTEIWLTRLAIRFSPMRTLIGDHDRDLVDLDRILTTKLGFPKLPTSDFDDRAGIKKTDEYLRRILPNFSEPHLPLARQSAVAFVQELAVEKEADR